MIRHTSVLSTVPCREALLGEGSAKEGELKARFCLAWTSLCLYAPSSSCRWMESYSTPSKGEMQRCLCSWKGRGGGLAFCKACPGRGSFPEMWQLGKRQVVWWLCDAVTFALGRWPGWRGLREISGQQRGREGRVTRPDSCLPQAARAGLSGRGGFLALLGSFW